MNAADSKTYYNSKNIKWVIISLIALTTCFFIGFASKLTLLLAEYINSDNQIIIWITAIALSVPAARVAFNSIRHSSLLTHKKETVIFFTVSSWLLWLTALGFFRLWKTAQLDPFNVFELLLITTFLTFCEKASLKQLTKAYSVKLQLSNQQKPSEVFKDFEKTQVKLNETHLELERTQLKLKKTLEESAFNKAHYFCRKCGAHFDNPTAVKKHESKCEREKTSLEIDSSTT